MPDSLAERGEFELPVPICEQSDDSIRLALQHRDELQSAIAPGQFEFTSLRQRVLVSGISAKLGK